MADSHPGSEFRHVDISLSNFFRNIHFELTTPENGLENNFTQEQSLNLFL